VSDSKFFIHQWECLAWRWHANLIGIQYIPAQWEVRLFTINIECYTRISRFALRQFICILCATVRSLYIETKNKITLNITSLSSICVLIMLQPRRQPLMPSCTPPSHVLPLSLSSLSRCDLSQANSCLIVSMCASASCISSLSKRRRFCTHSMLSLLYPKLLGEIPWGAIWTWGDLVSRTMMVTWNRSLCVRTDGNEWMLDFAFWCYWLCSDSSLVQFCNTILTAT